MLLFLHFNVTLLSATCSTCSRVRVRVVSIDDQSLIELMSSSDRIADRIDLRLPLNKISGCDSHKVE